ncbi:MAG: hypothetical protein IJY42_06530 [Clostridia bacterium]|nr:hypothetical protein [Clostridia bacterium]MBQ9793394.1 hypothetical protein [Clostridia bacterium]
MFKKLTALFLLLALCFCAVSCGGGTDDDVPDGMRSATQSGQPFRLYVPESWTLNHQSGISGACLYYTLDSLSAMVTARFLTRENAEESLRDYTNRLIAAYSESLEGFPQDFPAVEDTTLSGQPALRFSYTATVNGSEMECVQYVVFWKEDAVLLNLYASKARMAESRDSIEASFAQIKDAFVLCDKTVVNTNDTDKNTPDGMKIASSKDIEYRLYVPTSWICDHESGVSQAYVASDRSNVTVFSYAPEVSMSVADYFARSEEAYKLSVEGYVRTAEPTKREIAGRDASVYTYEATYSGVTYRVMQAVLAYGECIYSITYTAKADCFDSHIPEVEQILHAFTFR